MHPALRGAVQRLSAEGVNYGPEADHDDTMEDGMMQDGMMRDGMMRDGGMMDRMTGGAWMGPLLGVLVILVLVALVVLVVVLVNQRGTQARDQGQRGGESPREILDRRYAAGELSPEEYRQARDDLDG